MWRVFPKNLVALGTISVPEPLMETGKLEMPSRQSSVCAVIHVNAADVTEAKQADF
jgi:hypothetical protein